MPLFECPKCKKQQHISLAMCEWMLDSLPPPRLDTENNPVYTLKCADCIPVKLEIVEGDLLDQDVDVIVNAWNRNILPWWLLLPQGVSGAIKRRGGTAPFKELRRHGSIPLGDAVLTSAGRLPFKGIIHVAGINLLWRASERSIRDSVRNAVLLAHENGLKSMAFPLIGAGSGGFDPEQAKAILLDELARLDVPMRVRVVLYKKAG
jgi:O-acetyl-ADP-ribose deacetylase (regulator of RNase III)